MRPHGKSSVKKFFWIAIKVLISVVGLGFIFFLFKSRSKEIIQIFRDASPSPFLAAVCLFLLGLTIVTTRLRLILRVQNAILSFAQLFYFTLVGHFFSLFLPSAIGGDVVKGYYIYKKSGKKAASFTSVFLDRFVGSLAILTLGLLALAYYGKKLNVVQLRNTVLAIFFVMLCGLTFLMNKKFASRFKFLFFLIPSQKLKGFLTNLYHRINYYQHHKKVLLWVFLISVAAQCVFIAVYYLLARSLHLPVHYFSFFLVIPIVSVLSMAPSINGLGVREAGFVYLFSWFTSSESALALSLAYDALVYGTGLLFGVFFLLREGFGYNVVNKAMHAEEQFEKMEEFSK